MFCIFQVLWIGMRELQVKAIIVKSSTFFRVIRGGGLSRCPREPHMMYSGVAASHLRRARGGAQWQGHDL